MQIEEESASPDPRHLPPQPHGRGLTDFAAPLPQPSVSPAGSLMASTSIDELHVNQVPVCGVGPSSGWSRPQPAEERDACAVIADGTYHTPTKSLCSSKSRRFVVGCRRDRAKARPAKNHKAHTRAARNHRPLVRFISPFPPVQHVSALASRSQAPGCPYRDVGAIAIHLTISGSELTFVRRERLPARSCA